MMLWFRPFHTHMHLLNYAMFQKDVALFGIKSIEEIIVLCQERIAQRHPNYLLGIGWDQEIMAEGRMPTRADMDRISTEIPVCTIRSCFHVAVCNTVMLEQIRNLKNSTAEILRYVDFEQGILREDAMRLYIVLGELTCALKQCGFRVEYSEESTGFAPYGNDDPPVIRVVAVKPDEEV